jgi:hypothetical protein
MVLTDFVTALTTYLGHLGVVVIYTNWLGEEEPNSFFGLSWVTDSFEKQFKALGVSPPPQSTSILHLTGGMFFWST